MSIRAWFLSAIMRRTIRKQFDSFEDAESFRKVLAESGSLTPQTPDHIAVEPVNIEGVDCEWIAGKDADFSRVLIYLHGGGYVIGGPDSHRDIAWRLSEAGAMRVLLVDYRLAPEHPFPAAVEDATTCYRHLIDHGYDPARIAIAGDSAGGGLTIATMLHLKNLGMPLPNCAVVYSPWADLSNSGDSIVANEKKDVMLTPAALKKFATLYLGERDPKAPLASPLFGDLTGLPPILIHASDSEILQSDSERLARRLREAGGDVELKLWPKMPHVFPVFAARIPEGKVALEETGDFLRKRIH
ncbi:MAG: alpha/beta hydrolase [Pseudomonadales bacterium]|nr:alpha/beta hydrolase [Pseudomonadales bacterium]